MATPQHVIRLEERQLAELEKKLLPILVQSNTTDLLAGYTLGQQSVLKLLRDGFTISA